MQFKVELVVIRPERGQKRGVGERRGEEEERFACYELRYSHERATWQCKLPYNTLYCHKGQKPRPLHLMHSLSP